MNITGLTSMECAEAFPYQEEGTSGGPVVLAYPHISLEIWRQYSVLERIVLMDLFLDTNDNPAENNNAQSACHCGPSDPANDPPGGS